MDALSYLKHIVMPLPRFERMMRVLGIRERISALANSRAVLRRAEARCRGCPEPDRCEKWLDERETALQAPAYCRNRSMFARLIDQIEKEKVPG